MTIITRDFLYCKNISGKYLPSFLSFLLVFIIGLSAGVGIQAYYPVSFLKVASDTPIKESEKPTVRLGLAKEVLAALAMIARDKKYFSQEGVNVVVKEYASGKLALNGFLAGEVDIATTADIPIVFNSFKNDSFQIVSTIGSSDNEPRMIARKDRGIFSPADLKGKRVATQKASAVHFFLHLFLLQNEMDTEDVQLSFMKGKKLPKALADGQIDAFSMREPFISQAIELIGADNTVVFSRPGLYRKTFNLVATNKLTSERPNVARKIIKGLLRAESFAAQHHQDSINIVAKTLGAKTASIAAIWPDINLKVSLDQALLIAMEDEAKWVLANNFVESDQAPQYLDLIYLTALKDVDPMSVSLIH